MYPPLPSLLTLSGGGGGGKKQAAAQPKADVAAAEAPLVLEAGKLAEFVHAPVVLQQHKYPLPDEEGFVNVAAAPLDLLTERTHDSVHAVLGVDQKWS